MSTDYKQAIIDNLTAMRQIESKNKQFFKVRAYNKVIKQIQELTTPITSLEDLSQIQGIGEGIKEKLAIIFEKGHLNAAEPELANLEQTRAMDEFQKIMGVGAVKARELVEKHNITTIDQLRERTDLLNDKQKLGLRYHEDFEKRIPRKEMDKHLEFLTAAIPSQFTFQIAGSYRRGLASSGDIDVLITSDLPAENAKEIFQSVVTTLKSKKYLIDDFGFGTEKYLGIARLPRFRTHRRIDLMYIPREKFAFALLYFTGSQQFNISMRNKALEQGLSLSEHGLKYTKGPNKGEFVPGEEFKTEQDIFKFLKMDYVEPTAR